MDERGKTPLPGYLEIQSGDTLYKVSSVFAEKGDFQALWEAVIIDRILRCCDCKPA